MIVRERTDRRIVVASPAKLNLFLEVIARRDDGYHEIETVFQEIALFDEIVVERGVAKDEFSCDVAGLARPGENLVERAVEAFRRETGIREPLRIELTKTIPAGSGLGGGSSNAAGALQALDLLLGAHVPLERLEALAVSLGSDCAFFLHGGCAIGRGRGEKIEPLDDPPPRT
ncbi:MAG TPA: 4-(cytidine 5'-diphospho)-2-C-methyl-D-erythritol kinase, partial [Planctomycetota bacterium]|nr:4-(cytidine 5'-diphospho)-2-C-methyl-D-erythritol kinase [Planctomycetota bacterium]